MLIGLISRSSDFHCPVSTCQIHWIHFHEPRLCSISKWQTKLMFYFFCVFTAYCIPITDLCQKKVSISDPQTFLICSSSPRMSRALLLNSGWRAFGSLAPRNLTVPASVQNAPCSAMSGWIHYLKFWLNVLPCSTCFTGERMQQLAERLSPASASLVITRGIASPTIRTSDEEKVSSSAALCLSLQFPLGRFVAP